MPDRVLSDKREYARKEKPMDTLFAKMEEAVIAGMRVVRAAQGRKTQSTVKTADDTLVTDTDMQSQAAMLDVLVGIPNTRVFAEEDVFTAGNERYLLLIDPLDGTRAFANGLATSTVIAALYDNQDKQVIACCIGEPVTGRIWSANQKNSTTTVRWHQFGGMELQHGAPTYSTPRRVWNGRDSEGNYVGVSQQTVLLDVTHSFTRQRRKILTDVETASFVGSLSQEMKVLVPGSNGLNQALVANGGEKIAGSVTLAIGGPWDVAGAYLVARANGRLRAFSSHVGYFRHENPLDVLSYDILITGNSLDVVNFLAYKISDLRK